MSSKYLWCPVWALRVGGQIQVGTPAVGKADAKARGKSMDNEYYRYAGVIRMHKHHESKHYTAK